MLIIYTPGHSLYTDTLMMYALAAAARENLQRAVGQGVSYILAFEDLTELELAESLRVLFDSVKSEFSGRLARLIGEERRGEKEKGEKGGEEKEKGKKRKSDVDSALDSLTRIRELAGYLSSLSEPGHAWEEGRFGRGRSIKLPLMPSAGKYFRADLTKGKKYDTAEYAVCSYCFAVALLGLAVGTVSMGQGTTQVVSTLAFEGEVDGRSLRGLLNSFESLRSSQEELSRIIRVEEIPDRVLGSLLLTRFSDESIVQLYGTNASWKSLVVRFDVARAVQIRGFTTVELDPVLTAMEKLIELEERAKVELERGAVAEGVERLAACRSRFNGFVEKMLSLGACSALEKLIDFLATRNLPTLYAALRDAYASANGKLYAGSELVHCLAYLSLEYE
ncbi:MAG: hypothetical protein QXQ60_05820 [Thermofilum sp.]